MDIINIKIYIIESLRIVGKHCWKNCIKQKTEYTLDCCFFYLRLISMLKTKGVLIYIISFCQWPMCNQRDVKVPLKGLQI